VRKGRLFKWHSISLMRGQKELSLWWVGECKHMLHGEFNGITVDKGSRRNVALGYHKTLKYFMQQRQMG
jgi:hypothetical protein